MRHEFWKVCGLLAMAIMASGILLLYPLFIFGGVLFGYFPEGFVAALGTFFWGTFLVCCACIIITASNFYAGVEFFPGEAMRHVEKTKEQAYDLLMYGNPVGWIYLLGLMFYVLIWKPYFHENREV